MEHDVLTETCVYNNDNIMMTHFHFCYVTWIHRCTVNQRIFHILLKSVNVRTSQTPSLKNIERLNGLLFWNTAYNLYWNILNMCTIKQNSDTRLTSQPGSVSLAGGPGTTSILTYSVISRNLTQISRWPSGPGSKRNPLMLKPDVCHNGITRQLCCVYKAVWYRQ